jgi:uncharacterized phage protein (TIGR01671 family)
MNNIDSLKYRIWDITKQCYIDDVVLYPDGSFAIFDWSLPEYTAAMTEDDGYIVEQCIGFKDKHGKLIYVGDIIFYDATPYDVSIPRITGTIVHGRDGFYLDVKKYLDLEKELQPLQSFLRHAFYLKKTIEIIGNIHNQENVTLFTDKE